MSDETQKFDILQETKRHLNAGIKVFNGRYELVRELGSGGMGVVWLANDLEVRDRVALKFLPGLVRDPEAERDLREEVKNARNLIHENIVGVRTLLTDVKTIAVEMEYVDGPNVVSMMAAEPTRCLPLEKAQLITRGLCLAIDYAWTPPRRVVHRDIKPHNLLVNSAGQVKVVDFGIAHTVSETVTRITGRTSNDKVVGTLPYMSPQQLRGEVSHSNDIYSIGATIFHMITGTPPFRATDAAMLTRQITDEPAPTMAERQKQLVQEGRPLQDLPPIPKLWEEVVAACLSKNPAMRPQTAREIAFRLGLVAQKQAYQTGDIPSPLPKAKKHPELWLLGATVLVAAGAAGWWWKQSQDSKTEPPAPIPVVEPVPPKPAVTDPTPNPATRPTALRTQSNLVVNQPADLSLTNAADKKVLFNGPAAMGQKILLPVDTPLLLQTNPGALIATDIDAQITPLPAAPSGRWTILIPANPAQPVTVQEAPPPPPPFEAEVGPLLKTGQVNRAEADWLRTALGGDQGEQERARAEELAKAHTLTPGQWRARTSFKFKPDTAALLATDPAQMARAIDIVLPPKGVEMRLLRVEGGQFLRGAPLEEVGRRPGDRTPAQVRIEQPFFMGIFEVTQAQYESIMKRSPSYWRGNPTWPVDQVTWADIMGNQGFIAKLNAALDKTYNGVLVADLPTEDEWEYACRATTENAFNNDQPITKNDTDPALANIAHYNKANGTPRPVGSFEPNKWGFYDMHGNLQEWTQDRYLRGGSYESKAAACRSAARNQTTREANASRQTGFRLILRLHAPTPTDR